MPSTLTIDRNAGVVYSTFSGHVSGEDLLQHIAALRKHPDFDPMFSELIDFTQVETFEVASDMVRNLAMTKSPFDPEARRVVVASEDLLFGLARMFQFFSGDRRQHFDVVRKVDDACEKLGIQRPMASERQSRC